MNAKEKFREVVQQRMWHGSSELADQQRFAPVKTLAMRGKLSYEKSREWLERLGYVCVQEEVWEKQP